MNQKHLNNIFLTGFMGVGKSTIGQLLADRLGCSFHDTDEMIEQREQRSIKEIFASDGEGYFRDCETSLLQGLKQGSMTVYATGGGIVVREENRHLMSRLGYTVHLRCSWPALKARLQKSMERPLVNSANNWDDVKSLWVQRQPFYEQAETTIDTAALSPLQVVQKIILELSL